MNKKIGKFLTILALTFLGTGLLWINSVSAITGDLIIDFQDDPLFKEVDFKPGDNITRWVEVTNNTGETQRIVTEAINYNGFPESDDVPADDLSRALMIVISKNGTDLYGGSSPTDPKSLYNFYQDSENYLEIYLSDIGNGETIQYDFTISFPYDKGNEWQEKTTYFDILIGSQGETNPPPPSPPSPPSPGGGALPGLSILNEDSVLVTSGSSSATIVWTTSYFSTSEVIYDTIPGKFDFSAGPSKYGYAYLKGGDDSGLEKVTAHTVTITGLTPGTTYYFRCVSHASPPTITREFNFTTEKNNTEQKTGEAGESEESGGTVNQIAFSGENESGKESVGGNEITAGTAGQNQQEDENNTLGAINNETEKQTGKGSANLFSSGLASIIDALKNLFGRKIFICTILIIIIFVLIFLLLKKRKKKKEENKPSGTLT